MTTEYDLYACEAPAHTTDAIFKHMLLPIDFSESNIAAAQYARNLAGTNSHMTLLHVKRAATDSNDAPMQDKYVLDRVTRLLGGASVQTVTTAGDPAKAILQYASENDVDLIVMPTRGVGPVRRFVLGSVTAEVLRNSACPVLTFVAEDGAPAITDRGIRRIVCSIDLGPDSLRILHAADALATRCGAVTTIVHVSPQLEPMAGVVHEREWGSYLASVLRAEIDKLRREAGIEASVRVAGGEPAQTVWEVASDLNADLLVIGRPRPRGILGRLRTHAYAIISQAPCPVLSV